MTKFTLSIVFIHFHNIFAIIPPHFMDSFKKKISVRQNFDSCKRLFQFSNISNKNHHKCIFLPPSWQS